MSHRIFGLSHLSTTKLYDEFPVRQAGI